MHVCVYMGVYICFCLTFLYLFYVYITKQIQNLSDKNNKNKKECFLNMSPDG